MYTAYSDMNYSRASEFLYRCTFVLLITDGFSLVYFLILIYRTITRKTTGSNLIEVDPRKYVGLVQTDRQNGISLRYNRYIKSPLADWKKVS